MAPADSTCDRYHGVENVNYVQTHRKLLYRPLYKALTLPSFIGHLESDSFTELSHLHPTLPPLPHVLKNLQSCHS
jgi:hypothetical protein